MVRGIVVIHEAVRRWAEIFGRNIASSLRLRVLRFADKLNLDEVAVIISDVAQMRLPCETGHLRGWALGQQTLICLPDRSGEGV